MSTGVKKSAKLVLRYLVRDFYELNKLFKKFQEMDKKEFSISVDLLKKEINSLLRRLRGSIISGEERIEYRLVQKFKKLQRAIAEANLEINQKEEAILVDLMSKAEVYNSDLERLGARGGEIEKALRYTYDHPNKENFFKVRELLAQAMKSDRAFEIVIENIIRASEQIKPLRSKVLPIKYEHLALVTTYYPHHVFVLYDQKQYRQEMDQWRARMDLRQKGSVAASKYIEDYSQRIKDYSVQSSGFFEHKEKLLDVQHRILEKAIIGSAILKEPQYGKDAYLNAMEIWKIGARKGWGSLLLELILSFAAENKHPVIMDHSPAHFGGGVSKEMRKLWHKFESKPTVIKYPIALRSLPEAIGYNKREVLELFGTTGVFNSHTFNQWGIPDQTPDEKINQFLLRNVTNSFKKSKLELTRWDTSIEYRRKKDAIRNYLLEERKEGQTSGETACLEKAYYYEESIPLLQELLNKGKPDLKEGSFTFDNFFKIPGEAFFQRFADKILKD